MYIVYICRRKDNYFHLFQLTVIREVKNIKDVSALDFILFASEDFDGNLSLITYYSLFYFTFCRKVLWNVSNA